MAGKRPIITGVSKGIGGGFARPDAAAGGRSGDLLPCCTWDREMPDERKPLNTSILTAR